ncbi:uncharacterized protein LOC129041566 [Pongo pygmaeus]|uniref:uncharacterized protein LOC129041566 n=1 Tax=Pongo pygmaeus TaxID=9600 RepID=UPI0023E16269|nr:uncharacterized protein LOC129041566 [Pongo pygmaeus]
MVPGPVGFVPLYTLWKSLSSRAINEHKAYSIKLLRSRRHFPPLPDRCCDSAAARFTTLQPEPRAPPGPKREALAGTCGDGSCNVRKARLRPRPQCPGADSLRQPAGASGQQGGRTDSTGRSGPGGGWDLKVPSHLLPVLGPGTLEEPGWRLQKIPGWRKQPRARVAAAGVSERDEPPETELRPRPAPSSPHAAPPARLSRWRPRVLAVRVTSGCVGARKKILVWNVGTGLWRWLSAVLPGKLGTDYPTTDAVKEEPKRSEGMCPRAPKLAVELELKPQLQSLCSELPGCSSQNRLWQYFHNENK